ncbi:MAG: nuclear transport factor 2 family protein, partial [Candidatus Zixiibacteriota bacterium]
MRAGQWVAFGVLALTLTLLVGGCSKSAGLTERVMAYQKAYNEHSVEDVVGMFAGNASFEIVGNMRLQGRNEIRDLVEYEIALNIQLDITNPQARGDTVLCKVAATNDWLTVAGIDTARFDATFVFEAGKIERVVSRPSAATAKAVRDIRVPLNRW